MDAITIPTPEEIERRIASCRAEIKALSRLLRMSRAAKIATLEKRDREQNLKPTALKPFAGDDAVEVVDAPQKGEPDVPDN